MCPFIILFSYICSRITVIRSLDSLLSLSPDDEQLYSSWQYLYRAIGMCNKSLDMIDLQSVRLTDTSAKSCLQWQVGSE
ncbi:hypothetical protein PREVCOP_05117 [Segatella copri DSM 18205]|uniref:Uncharacterized protein n=1 Tax=Segatella copri DSM 18205 TaxID=537011 RepID=D1PD31_9BACT|nr:hypothetical protein PREVCOP_05117 [Segatella copri DSM 18205]